MKVLLVGIFFLFVSSLSFASTRMVLKCDSKNEWVLGGVSRLLTLEIDNRGNILSGLFDGEKYRTTSNSLIWFDGQEDPKNTIPEYGSFEYSFHHLQLKNVAIGMDVEVIVEGRDYLAFFHEAARCRRIQ